MNQSTNVPTDAERAEALAVVQAKRDEKVYTFQSMLAAKLERGVRVRHEFIEHANDNGILWAIEWSGRSGAQITAETEKWRMVEASYAARTNAEEKFAWLASAVGAITEVRDEVERDLVRNYVHKFTTDPFGNAVSAARAEGYARFYEESGKLLDRLTEE